MAIPALATTAQARPLPAEDGQHIVTTAPARPGQLTAAFMRHGQPATYTVKPGDTLSDIAGRFYHNPALYPSLWWINKGKVRDPNVVRVGQVLKLSHWHPQAAWLAAAAKKADPPVVVRSAGRHMTVRAHRDSRGRIWKVTYGYPYKCGDGDGNGYDTPCSVVFPHHHERVVSVYRSSSGRHSYRRSYRRVVRGSYHGSGSFERCVIARESGGNSQVMNGSGHYGLYQFSASTWRAYGGSSGSFGHASVATQKRVFDNAMAQGGQSNWSPYDGC
jgi:hypothetical protein